MHDLYQNKFILHQHSIVPYRGKLNIRHDVPIINTYTEDLSKGIFSKKNLNQSYAKNEITKIIHEIHVRNLYTHKA